MVVEPIGLGRRIPKTTPSIKTLASHRKEEILVLSPHSWRLRVVIDPISTARFQCARNLVRFSVAGEDQLVVIKNDALLKSVCISSM
jgi:hypothetical protein